MLDKIMKKIQRKSKKEGLLSKRLNDAELTVVVIAFMIGFLILLTYFTKTVWNTVIAGKDGIIPAIRPIKSMLHAFLLIVFLDLLKCC